MDGPVYSAISQQPASLQAELAVTIGQSKKLVARGGVAFCEPLFEGVFHWRPESPPYRRYVRAICRSTQLQYPTGAAWRLTYTASDPCGNFSDTSFFKLQNKEDR